MGALSAFFCLRNASGDFRGTFIEQLKLEGRWYILTPGLHKKCRKFLPKPLMGWIFFTSGQWTSISALHYCNCTWKMAKRWYETWAKFKWWLKPWMSELMMQKYAGETSWNRRVQKHLSFAHKQPKIRPCSILQRNSFLQVKPCPWTSCRSWHKPELLKWQ